MNNVKRTSEGKPRAAFGEFSGSHTKGIKRPNLNRMAEKTPLPYFNHLRPATPAPLLPDGTKMEQYHHYPIQLLKDFPLGKSTKGKQNIVKAGSNHTVMRLFNNAVALVKDEILCFKMDPVVGVDFEYLPEPQPSEGTEHVPS